MTATQHDVIIIGTGFAGIYAIHKYRDQLSLDVQGFDAASDVGGTWYWNRYPGARVDIESVNYSFSFDDELQQEWHWTEKFAAGPEILKYLNHCADRYDIRRSVQFNTRIVALTWDERNSHWVAIDDKGVQHTARYYVSGAGTLSVPKKPEWPGVENFAGQVLLTGNWTSDVDLTGRKVGIIGTGSSGIQAISAISKVADELHVFQRTPNFATPIANHTTDPKEEAADKARYKQIREASRNHFLGVPYSEVQPSALAVSSEERQQVYEDRWKRGGFRLFIDSFTDILFDKKANDTVSDFIRDKIKQRVEDPKVADLLCPKNYPYATKRPPLEEDYYEAYNRPATRLYDVRTNPIDEITAKGVRLVDGTEVEIDTLVLATGFDACTGPLLAMNVTGRNGVQLREVWEGGPATYLGLTVAGFPNLFMITGPQSPSVLYNMPLAIEDHIDLIGDFLVHMVETGQTVVEATQQAQDQWVIETNAMANMTLLPTSPSTWYMGANVPGKPRRVLVYIGGAPRYRAICDNVQQNGYRGFRFATSSAGLDLAKSATALDPAVMFLVEALKQQGFTGFRAAGVEGSRAAVDSFKDLQAKPPEVAEVKELAYGDDPDQKLRIYRPEREDGGGEPLPVVVYVHGGGFVAGGLDVVDEPARDLAVRAGAMVVAVTYRRAPEHHFPAAHDDANSAVEWVYDNISEHGGDPHQMVLAGDSAGGTLALASAIDAARKGIPLDGLLLIYPLVNPTADNPSRKEFAKGYIIGTDDLMWFAEQYFARVADLSDPRVALASADLHLLPPTLVITNECDPTRDEAQRLVEAIKAADVSAGVQRFDGLAHGVFWMSLAVPRCVEQREAAATFVREQVGIRSRDAVSV